jgi:hypothetical protein
MFYLLKNILILILIIFKLKCNNLIFNEIMVLNDLYVCLHAFSFRQESLIKILKERPLIFRQSQKSLWWRLIPP